MLVFDICVFFCDCSGVENDKTYYVSSAPCMSHNFVNHSVVVFVCVMAALTSMSAIDMIMIHMLKDVELPP